MIILVRYALIGLIIYLVIRSFVRYWELGESSTKKREPEKKNDVTIKKVSKDVGDYIDYEEVDD